MRSLSIVLFMLLFDSEVVLGQNLIPNPSFEEYSNCPYKENQVNRLLHWFNPATTFGGTPDYFNACANDSFISVPYNFAGFQSARTGQGYCGMILLNYNLNVNYNYHEFIEVPLISELQQDSCYYFEMFVSLCEQSHPTTDDIGIYFSDTIISGVNNYYPLPFSPQIVNEEGFIKDRLGWTQITNEYQAHGGEKYLIIGNFTSDSMTSFMITSGCCWSEAYFYIDDVSLTPSPCLSTGITDLNEINNFKVFPNPIEVNSKLVFDNPFNETFTLTIYNSFGQTVHTIRNITSNAVDLPYEYLHPGIYNLQMRSKDALLGNSMIVVK